MPLFTAATVTGNYEASPLMELARAEYVLGHEFGTPANGNGSGAVNEAIAEEIARHYADRRLYVAETIAEALGRIDRGIEIAGVFEGISSDTTNTHGGSWEELRQAREMAGDALQQPILVGQAFHIGRVARQARKAGLDPLLPPDLPTAFDPESSQWWCRNRGVWMLRELPGTPVLKLRGQL